MSQFSLEAHSKELGERSYAQFKKSGKASLSVPKEKTHSKQSNGSSASKDFEDIQRRLNAATVTATAQKLNLGGKATHVMDTMRRIESINQISQSTNTVCTTLGVAVQEGMVLLPRIMAARRRKKLNPAESVSFGLQAQKAGEEVENFCKKQTQTSLAPVTLNYSPSTFKLPSATEMLSATQSPTDQTTQAVLRSSGPKRRPF